MNLDVRLNADNPVFQINCIDPRSCAYTRGIITAGNENDVIISTRDSYVNCFSDSSCLDASFVFTGIHNVELNCHGTESCKWLGITSKSWNTNQKYNTLNVNCYTGTYVCQNLTINGMSSSNVNIICHSNINGNECDVIQVYCPINPFINNNNYSLSNIDANSCNIDFNGAGWGIINAIYGTTQSNISNTNNNDNNILICDFDWLYKHIWCNNSQLISTNVINKFIENNLTMKISNPNSNELSCDNNNCIMYAFEQNIPITNVICPNGNYSCSIIWYIKYIYISILNVYWPNI